MGRLRVYAHLIAAAGVIAPIWVGFQSTYPELHLEIAVGDAPIDIVANGSTPGSHHAAGCQPTSLPFGRWGG